MSRPVLAMAALVVAVVSLLASVAPERLSARGGVQQDPLSPAARRAETARFFPMAVWYGGGTARAPMIEGEARAKKETWRKDVRQIRALGFNTVRAWIDWASGEPAEGEYDFETLDVLLELAREEGLRLVLQVYVDSAPAWVGRKYPDSLGRALLCRAAAVGGCVSAGARHRRDARSAAPGRGCGRRAVPVQSRPRGGAR